MPRSVKVVTASEQQRDKVLTKAKKLAWQHPVWKSVDTTGPYSETKREKAGAGTATKTEESGRRDELNNR